MAKKKIEVKCESVNANANQSTVRFIIPAPPAPPAKPGESPQPRARTIITFQYSEAKSAMDYEVGKDYTITIE